MPKAKAKAKAKAVRTVPKAKPQLDRYAYLPTDLQRAAVFMDRGDFLRKLQKNQHDREYRHVATQGPTPLSADGAKDLQDKIAALSAEIAGLRAGSAPGAPGSTWRGFTAAAAPGSATTAPVPGSRMTAGGFSASRTPFAIPTDDDL